LRNTPQGETDTIYTDYDNNAIAVDNNSEIIHFKNDTAVTYHQITNTKHRNDN